MVFGEWALRFPLQFAYPHKMASKMDGLNFFHPSWPVFFEDNHLLILYKPAGLLVQGDVTEDVSLLDLGKAWVKERRQKPGKVFLGLVHRLDRPVAGVIAFARTSKAASRLSEQFRSGKTRKSYTAVVEGVMPEKSGALVDYIERGERTSRIVSAPGPQVREARLSYRVVDSSESESLVEIWLETGRKHQIRLQLAHGGHPVLGDLRYGAAAPLPERRIALFAHELTIEHPTRKEPLTFRAPFPRGWPWPMPEGEGVLPWDWSELRSLIQLPGGPAPA